MPPNPTSGNPSAAQYQPITGDASTALAGQELLAVRSYLQGRITELRLEYATLNASVKATLAANIARHGKPKLQLPMCELVVFMQQREDRAAAQHRLLLLVPVMRLVRAAAQQQNVLKVKTGRKLPELAQLIYMHCAGALKHAKPEVVQLYTAYPALLGSAMPGAASPASKATANSEKALALHAKLLASGLLDSDEVITLRKVFAQYPF